MRIERIGKATLYLADCRDALREIAPSGGFVAEALITDPPYGIGYSPGGGGRGAFGKPVHKRFTGADVVHGDDQPFDPAPFLTVAPKTLLWGANNYAQRLPHSPAWLIWDKREAESTLSFADCEMAWTNLPGQARIFRHMWNGVAKASEQGQRRVHPTQKPIALMTWCMKQAGNPASVFDPYMGSGTTGIAAVMAGATFIGVELKEHHFETACARIEDAQRNERLFA